MLSGNVAQLALGFVSSVLIARALGPATFATYALLGAIANIGAAVGELGLSSLSIKRIAEVWPHDPGEARRRVRLFLLLRVGGCVALALAGTALAHPLAGRILGSSRHVDVLRLTFAGILATAISGAAHAVLQGTGRFGRLSLVGLANPGLTAVLAVVLAAAGRLDLMVALLWLGIVPSLISAVIGYRLWPAALGLRTLLGQPSSAGGMTGEAVDILRPALLMWVANSLAMIFAYLDMIIVSDFVPSATVGFYALALNLSNKAAVVNSAFHTVLLPSAVRLDSPGALGAYTRSAFKRAALFGGGLLLIAPLGGPLIRLFYGQAFAPAASLLNGLLLVVFFDILVHPFLLLALTTERARLMVAAELVRLGLLGALGPIWVQLLGPSGAIWAKLVSRVGGAVLILVILAAHLRVGSLFRRPPAGTGPGSHPGAAGGL
jgi:O-antigen/teichoic acid export membrane protein